MCAPPVDVPGLGWDAVARDVLSLKGRLGFGSRIRFLHFEVLDDGHVLFENPVSGLRAPVDERVQRVAWTMLHAHAAGDETCIVALEDETFTRISLLDDSMHLGCSTNQHRIEDAFRDLLDACPGVAGVVLERHFDATPVDKGDLAFRIPLLPRVPALLVYHAGEEGLASSAGIFFEVHALRFLPRIACESLEELFLHAVLAIIGHVKAGPGPGG